MRAVVVVLAQGPSQAKTEIWLLLVDALRNFVFDPPSDFVALIHAPRADPLPGIRGAMRPPLKSAALAAN
jgi:hypothetical protein